MPLILCNFSKKDSGAGKNLHSRVIDSSLNFNNYSELLAAIFTITIALERKDFNNTAKLYEIFVPDKADPKKFTLLKSDLDNIPSIIKTFIRKKKLIIAKY